jgi:hypothetical protein
MWLRLLFNCVAAHQHHQDSLDQTIHDAVAAPANAVAAAVDMTSDAAAQAATRVAVLLEQPPVGLLVRASQAP